MQSSGLQMYCIPHAGGSAAIYHSWIHCCDVFDVLPLDFAGHGARFKYPLCNDWADLITDIATSIMRRKNGQFVLFGHSLGALVAYEVCHRFASMHKDLPIALVVSSSSCPAETSRRRTEVVDLTEAQLIEYLRNLGGTDELVLENRELLQLMMPIIRNDLALHATYRREGRPALNVPVLAIHGDQDPFVSKSELERWKAETTSEFVMRMFPGDHFYLRSCGSIILNEISAVIRRWANASG